MNLREQLKAKQAELVALKDAIDNGDQEAITKGLELKDAMKNLEDSIAKQANINEFLSNIGPAKESNEANPSTSKKSGMKSILDQLKNVDRKVKNWSVNANFKDASNTDPITSVELAELDRTVELSTIKVPRIADLFPQAHVADEYNSVTYIKQNAVLGSAGVVAEGGKKPQISTGFTPVTDNLKKIAVYVKETDETVKQASLLQGAIDETVTRTLIRKENSEFITDLTATTASSDAEYDEDATDTNITTQNFMEAIKAAASQIETNTDYVADLVIMNPDDVFKMSVAKDKNGQYFGGGWATGAYGNGNYNGAANPWGLTIFKSNEVQAGDAFVFATDACKIYRQGDINVRIFDQNEDDPIYNLIMIRAEEYGLAITRNTEAVVKVTPSE